MHGARPAWDQVQQPCRGMILPSSQVHDASELTGPSSASVLVMPYVLINPQHPNPCEAGGVVRCGSQTRLDMGPHSIPRGAAYPASLKPPQPCQDPGLGRVDHLHHHTPVALSNSPHNQGTPPAGCTTQHQAPGPLGVRATLIRWKPSKPTSRSHRSSDTQQQQVGPDTARGP